MTLDLTKHYELVPIEITEGETWPFVLKITSGGEPLVLTGSTITCSIKKRRNDQNTVQTLSLGSGLTITGDDFNWLAATPAALDAGKYIMKIRIQLADTSVHIFTAVVTSKDIQ